MRTFETLSEAIDVLKKEGYQEDFNLHPEYIECKSLNSQYAPSEFHVDGVYRFEGMTDPDDSSVLFAISSTDGKRGLLVDAYGAYAQILGPGMLGKLHIDSKTLH
ncbi:MAG: phosphoribosylpyrophosphate synthetase [Bacteroidota bacterium]